MKNRKIENQEIYSFFRKLDRALFIDNENRQIAYLDSPLPIGYGQTISQPTLVHSMTCSLELESHSRVLEIGTGSGYQTAFLAEFTSEVYTIERIEALALKAQETLEMLGYRNITYIIGDGSMGWSEHSPFDRIIVTAAAERVPDTLIEQLSTGGRMIIPVGPRTVQELLLIKKDEKGNISKESLGGVRFVEMKGEYGWN